jgi:hypothetical protein
MTSPERPVRQLFIDAGEQGALTAGHGHADALSLQLASGGRLWLTDPGTFCYVGNGRVREAFRGTAAHNTMTVDGLDQAQPAGPFSWGPRPQVAARQWASSEEFDLFEGSHSGYERLGEPVTHRRWVVRLGAGLWLVRDLAEGHGTHQLDLRWHFAPDLDVSARGPALVASCGGEEMMLLPVQAEPWELSLEAGEFSPVYGVKVPAPVAAWSARTACPAEFAIVIGFAPKLPPPSLTRRIAAGATGYECSWNDVRYRVFFAERGRSWVCGEWASDAAVLCLAVQKEGSVRGFFSEGSYVEHMGQRVIESGGPARYLVFGEQDGIWSAGPSGESLPSLSLP